MIIMLIIKTIMIIKIIKIKSHKALHLGRKFTKTSTI